MHDEDANKPDSDEEMLTVEEDDEEDGEEGEAESKDANAGGTSTVQDDETKNMTSCIRLLRFLQLLCEGHHSPL